MMVEHDVTDALQFKTADEIRQIIPDWNLGSAWIDATQTFGGSGLREPREAGEICLLIVPLRKGQPIDGKEPPQSGAFDIDYAVGAYVQDDVDKSHGFVDLAKTAEWATFIAAFPEIPSETVGFESLPVTSDLQQGKDLLLEMNDLLHVQTSDSVFGIGETARESWGEFAGRISLMSTVGDAQSVWIDIDKSLEQARSKHIEGRSETPFNLYQCDQHLDVSLPVDYSLTLQKDSQGDYVWGGDLHIPFEDSEVVLTDLEIWCPNATEAATMTASRAIDLLDLNGDHNFWISYETADAIIASWEKETEENR